MALLLHYCQKFFNVLVKETLDIIMQIAYNHSLLSPPCIKLTVLCKLLSCTTQVPFHDNYSNTKTETDGVAMRLPLGSTLFNFTWLT